MKEESITVRELIAELSKFPQHLPVYLRPKYRGNVEYHEDCGFKKEGISEMEYVEGRNVTILF